MRRALGTTAVIIVTAAVSSGATIGIQKSDDVTAVEKAALDRWGSGDPEGYLSIYDDSIGYFDPFQPTRVDSRDSLRALYGPLKGKIHVDRYEIMQPRVQRSGDLAVYTFRIQNYAKQPDGSEKATSKWNVTEVFQRKGGQWRTIHSHFSFTTPDLKPPPGT
jgi:ketosteroid isomerase-like protein